MALVGKRVAGLSPVAGEVAKLVHAERRESKQRRATRERRPYHLLSESRVNARFLVGYWRRLIAIMKPTAAKTIAPSTTQSLQSSTALTAAQASATPNSRSINKTQRK
jgi:hypothetical protein